MTVFYIDPEGGDDANGGSSYDVLLSGSDGVTVASDFTFSSAAGGFTADMVGEFIAWFSDWQGLTLYMKIASFVNANSVTVDPLSHYYYGASATGLQNENARSFKVGGRWKYGKLDQYSINTDANSSFRLKASTDPYSIGNATWTNGNDTVTLGSAVAQTIEDAVAAFNTAGTATSSTESTFKRFSAGATRFGTPASGTAINTKYWYKALAAPLDLSAWQRVCLWFGVVTTAFTTGKLRLALCSDTAGNTIVAEFQLPYLPQANRWMPVTLDFAGPLPASVQSIAIYTGDVAPPNGRSFVITNIIAVKAAGDPLEFTFNHLLGKEHTKSWEATTAYALNKFRKPTVANRNGFRYKVTTAGTSGASEPTWPTEFGDTVVDGTVTWTCDGLEDTWYACRTLASGTAFRIDRGTHNSLTAITPYQREAGAIESFLRLPIILPAQTSDTGNALETLAMDTGEYGVEQECSGGWDRTNMSLQTGESWYDYQTTAGTGLIANAGASVANVGVVRAYVGIKGLQNSKARNVHAVSCYQGFQAGGNFYRVEGGAFENNQNSGLSSLTTTNIPARYVSRVACRSNPVGVKAEGLYFSHLEVHGNVSEGFWIPEKMPAHEMFVNKLRARYTTAGATKDITGFGSQLVPSVIFKNLDAPDRAITYSDLSFWTHDFDRRVTILADGAQPISHYYWGKVEADTVQRHTASGVSWKFTIQTTSQLGRYSFHRKKFTIVAAGGVATTITLWVKRARDGIIGRLVCLGGQVNGIPTEVSDHTTQADTNWEQLSITVTPTETCVLPVEFQLLEEDYVAGTPEFGSGSALILWIDDLAVA